MAPTAEAGCFSVPPDHPALPGHFPGEPIVPGVVLLDAAMALIAASVGSPPALSMAKFLAPVRPGEVVSVTYSAQADGIGFVCTVAGVAVLRGRLE